MPYFGTIIGPDMSEDKTGTLNKTNKYDVKKSVLILKKNSVKRELFSYLLFLPITYLYVLLNYTM